MRASAAGLIVRPLGEAALCCSIDAPVSPDYQQRVWELASNVVELDGVEDVIPGMNSLTVTFDALRFDGACIESSINALWAKTGKKVRKAGRLVDLPVTYGGTYGPDLMELAVFCNLSVDEVVRRHSAPEYIVYFIGFQPGFPYLGGLDPSLHMPRRSEPRLAVPAGSVGIGGAQTGVYPFATPGGWQIIGRTEARLFNDAALPPTLLAPGDRVRFVVKDLRS